MDLHRACAIFRIKSPITVQNLNNIYRDLVKKYHPDKVLNYVQWANERMTEINAAYEILIQWITYPPPTPKKTNEKPTPTSENTKEATPDLKSSIPSDASHILQTEFNHFLDGMSLFYEYGLENFSYRNEGIRRFRYREALRIMESSRDKLEDCQNIHQHPAIHAAARFARLTVADILLCPRHFQDEHLYRKFDERMRQARGKLDKAIKNILFPELVPSHQRKNTMGGLYASYTEFVLFLIRFEEGERHTAAVLQTARYNAFLQILELGNLGMLNF